MSLSVEELNLLQKRALEFFETATTSEIIAILVGVYFVFSFFLAKKSPTVAGAPVYGYRSFFEPTLWLQIRFTTNAFDIIESSYKKVRITRR